MRKLIMPMFQDLHNKIRPHKLRNPTPRLLYLVILWVSVPMVAMSVILADEDGLVGATIAFVSTLLMLWSIIQLKRKEIEEVDIEVVLMTGLLNNKVVDAAENGAIPVFYAKPTGFSSQYLHITDGKRYWGVAAAALPRPWHIDLSSYVAHFLKFGHIITPKAPYMTSRRKVQEAIKKFVEVMADAISE